MEVTIQNIIINEKKSRIYENKVQHRDVIMYTQKIVHYSLKKYKWQCNYVKFSIFHLIVFYKWRDVIIGTRCFSYNRGFLQVTLTHPSSSPLHPSNAFSWLFRAIILRPMDSEHQNKNDTISDSNQKCTKNPQLSNHFIKQSCHQTMSQTCSMHSHFPYIKLQL